MYTFSLILGTKGRTVELQRFLDCLDQQQYPNLQLIIADQNQDNRLIPILGKVRCVEECRHVRATPGLSHARNVGLSHARGKILAYPDDDCWYSPGLLARIDEWFHSHPGYSFLSIGVEDENGRQTANNCKHQSCDIDRDNVFHTSVSFSFFVRRNTLTEGVRFNERLGVGAGTAYGSGEDTDYILQLLKRGAKGRYESAFVVHHPDKHTRTGQISVARAIHYNWGHGHLLRKYGFPSGACLWAMLRPLCGACAYLSRGKLRISLLYVMNAWGRFMGYLCPLSD